MMPNHCKACFLLGMLSTVAVCNAGSLPTVTSGTLALQLEAGSGVTATGGLVSAWNDQSGNGNNVSQSNSTNQPTLIPNGSPNGLQPAIQFDGNRAFTGSPFLTQVGSPLGSFLAGTGQLPTGSNTVFMVYTPTANPGGAGNEEIPFAWGAESNGQLRSFYLTSPNSSTVNVGFAQYGGSDLGTKYSVAAGTPQLGSWTDTSGGTSPNLTGSFSFYNRTSGSTADTLEGTGSTSGSTTPPAGFELGGANIRTLGNYAFAGDISAVLVYSGVLSDADRQAVDNYLYGKYFATTPEPSSIALLGLGAAGLLLASRRRAQRGA